MKTRKEQIQMEALGLIKSDCGLDTRYIARKVLEENE